MKLSSIDTEQINERSAHIDRLSTLDMLRLINNEDKRVAPAVEKVLPQVALAVDAVYEKLSAGGRLVYSGSGTSGRLGILDAVECPPTFGTDPEQIRALIAGGEMAFIRAVEGAEDNRELGKKDLESIGFSKADAFVGIAASGRTPYVLGAMEYARTCGAPVISLTCCPGSEVDRLADIGIAPMPGPEVITGSTRLKSGTAQKLVLNMLSTAVMIRLGKVYGNLMVDVRATNEKLVERAVSIVCAVTGVQEDIARTALSRCGFAAKPAIMMLECDIGPEEAKAALDAADGRIAKAVQMLQKPSVDA